MVYGVLGSYKSPSSPPKTLFLQEGLFCCKLYGSVFRAKDARRLRKDSANERSGPQPSEANATTEGSITRRSCKERSDGIAIACNRGKPFGCKPTGFARAQRHFRACSNLPPPPPRSELYEPTPKWVRTFTVVILQGKL